MPNSWVKRGHTVGAKLAKGGQFLAICTVGQKIVTGRENSCSKLCIELDLESNMLDQVMNY